MLSVFLIGGALFFLLSIVYSTITTGISPMPSTSTIRAQMLERIPDDPKYLIDLGSGWGGLLWQLSRRYPDAKIVGYEVSWFPYLASKLMCRGRNIQVLRKNYLGVSFPKDAIFVCYLCPSSMKALSQSPPTTGWLISHTFALPGHNPVQTHICTDMYRTHIYVYRFS